MKSLEATKLGIKNAPVQAGVYLFRDEWGKVIYVGKAKSLINRLRSYYLGALEQKTAKMVASAKLINFITVSSEFEALLLEAKLVKKYQPKYNIQLRDDKSPLYIGITNDELPYVLLLRQKELERVRLRKVYGPFINGNAPKKVLRLIRRVFPFSTHKPGKRPCVMNQIGLCNPCPSEIITEGTEETKKALKREYMLNVRRVNAVLSGKSKLLATQLEREMQGHIAREDFEMARVVKRQLDALRYTTTREELSGEYLENPNLLEDIRERELKNLRAIIARYQKAPKLNRIECFDVAHLAGTYPTASMVTFVRGEPDKSLYRHFGLHNKNSDVDNMREVLQRRFKRDDWGKPDLIIVDGGKAQLGVAREVLEDIAIVGLAKREETLVFKVNDSFFEVKLPEGPAKKLVQRIRDEAHRFARAYHHKLVSRALKEI